MARKDDRRIQKTRKQLRESMMELILDRGYDDISIQDVTDRANLGRATFYLHYREKDDLYTDVIRSLADEYFATQPKQSVNRTHFINATNLLRFFNFVENQYDFYRIIIMGRGAILTSTILTQIVKEHFKSLTEQFAPSYEEAIGMSFDFLASFNASALISTVIWWLENGMPYTAEQMALMYEKVSFYTNFQILRATKDVGTEELEKLRKIIDEEAKTFATPKQETELEDAKDDKPEGKKKRADKAKDKPTNSEKEETPSNDGS